MKQSYQKLLRQLGEWTAKGKFATAAKASQDLYASLASDDAIMLQVALDFVQGNISHADEIAQVRDYVLQLLVVSYREASRKDQEAAEAFFDSFLSDYPDVAESALLPRWSSLVTAGLAMREVVHSESRLLIWQQASRLFQMSSEFIAGLLPYLIIMWRAIDGKSYNTSVFAQPLGGLVDQFSHLTGGEDGAFYPFFRVARPNVRNAIAHGTAWLDSGEAKVRYIDGRHEKREYEIDLDEFVVIATLGSHLAQSYLAALAVIAVMRFGSPEAKAALPASWSKVFSHPSPPE